MTFDLDPDLDLRIDRVIRAPRSRVWQAWTCLLYTSPSPRD